jgi:long-chain acyl-CoA synthetase
MSSASIDSKESAVVGSLLTEERPWVTLYDPHTPPTIGNIPFNNIADLVTQTCASYNRQTAFTACLPNGMFGSLSFAEIARHSDAIAAYLREGLGLNAGDRVALQLPNSLAYPIWAFGVFKAGCVLVNTNPLYTPHEMIHQFNDSGARVLVIVDLFADKIAPVVAKTKIEHVVLVRVTDLFPRLTGAIAYAVMKHWNRQIPTTTARTTSFLAALAAGERQLSDHKVNVPNYTALIGLDEIAVLQYTGGTTGVSKGAMLTHRNLLANMLQIHAMAGSRIELGKETALAVLPLYHIFAFTVNLLAFFYTGSRNILIASPRPLANLQRALENYPITWIPGVNTLFNGLLNEEWFIDYPPPKLKASLAGGAALHPSVQKRWIERTKTPVIEGYGLTEAAPVVSFNPFERPVMSGGVGVPVPDTEVRILDELGEPVPYGEPGELAVSGPQVMRGYWQRPEESAKVLRGGWLLTGDIAVMDPQGQLTLVDRKKDLVLVSGFNVYPNEVEACIAALPGVLEVAVIGVPDGHSGEAVRAYIVPQPGVTLTTEGVRAHCREQLAAYKIPKQIVFQAELPKSPVGKVLRRELRAAVNSQEVRGG